MPDFFKIILLFFQSLFDASVRYPEIDNVDPAQNFQLMIKDYGIDLKPKPFDPKLAEDTPKDRVITSSKAPDKKYTIKANKFPGHHLESESKEININRLTQTIGGMFNKTQ